MSRDFGFLWDGGALAERGHGRCPSRPFKAIWFYRALAMGYRRLFMTVHRLIDSGAWLPMLYGIAANGLSAHMPCPSAGIFTGGPFFGAGLSWASKKGGRGMGQGPVRVRCKETDIPAEAKNRE